MRHPGTARKPDHPFGPDIQVEKFVDFPNKDPQVHAIEQHDAGGVHVHSGEFSSVWARTVLELDNGNPVLAEQINLGVRILASMNQLEVLPIHQVAFLHIISAWMCFGDTNFKRVEDEFRIWEEQSVELVGFKDAHEVIKAAGLENYHKPQRTAPATEDSLLAALLKKLAKAARAKILGRLGQPARPA